MIGKPPALQPLSPGTSALQGEPGRFRHGAALLPGLQHLGLLALPPVLFLLTLSGGIVLSEPAPYEFVFLLVLVATLMSNAAFPPPLALPLLLISANIFSAAIAIIHGSPVAEPIRYIAVASYLSLSAIVIAMAISTAPMRVLPAIRWGYTLGALIAALMGIAGYFGIAAESFTLSGRASGPFDDPNVFGPFLIFPAIFLIVDVLRGNALRALISGVLLSIIMVAILLSFSRGAWAHFAVSAGAAVALLYITSDRTVDRLRIGVLGMVAVALGTIALAGLLSIPEVGTLFGERARLVQPYDVAGNTGRFSTQAIALREMTQNPLGFGALAFSAKYGLDPHNVYLKITTSNGWIGGIAYLAYVFATLSAGLKATFSRTPWRLFSLVATATFIGLMLEGLIIDTDPWRHFHLVAGAIWGCFAAQFVLQRKQRATAVFAPGN